MIKVFRKPIYKILLTPRVAEQFRRIQRFYINQFYHEQFNTRYTPWLDIHEGLTEEEPKALQELVRRVCRENMKVVEVGSWKGHSTSVLAKSVSPYHGSVFAVDHWKGAERTWFVEAAKAKDIYSTFKLNMIILGVWDIVHPLVMDSLAAAEIFADGILDLVFIDADHRYESIKKDILVWLPKLKNGGILCGHDCAQPYGQYSEKGREIINQHLQDDFARDVLCHPGIVKALYDCFQDKYLKMPNTSIWYYIKHSQSQQRQEHIKSKYEEG